MCIQRNPTSPHRYDFLVPLPGNKSHLTILNLTSKAIPLGGGDRFYINSLNTPLRQILCIVTILSGNCFIA